MASGVISNTCEESLFSALEEKAAKVKAVVDGTERDLIIKSAALSSYAAGSQTSVSFAAAFPTACIAVIPYCSQASYGAASSISIGSVTKSGFKIYQRNSQTANMSMRYVAIGY